jgi:hypothetical protein
MMNNPHPFITIKRDMATIMPHYGITDAVYSVPVSVAKAANFILVEYLCGRLLFGYLGSTYWIGMIATFLLGVGASDLIAGTAHYILDNHRSVDKDVIKYMGEPFLRQYIIHHDKPNLLRGYNFWATNSDGMFATSMLLWLVYGYYVITSYIYEYLSWSPWKDSSTYWLWFWMVYCVFTGFTNQFHKWSHKKHPNWFVAFLQKIGLALRFEDHQRHHANPEIGYCLTTGWCNPFLEHIGYWHGVKAIIVFLEGEEKSDTKKPPVLYGSKD